MSNLRKHIEKIAASIRVDYFLHVPLSLVINH